MKLRLMLAAALALAACPAAAQTVVSTGVVVRGVNAPPPAGASGTPSLRTCDFSRENLDQPGRMTGASVQCRAGGTLQQVLANLPATFNSYCVVDASRLKGARLITAKLSDNPEHCDLSAMTPKDAQQRFGGAMWR